MCSFIKEEENNENNNLDKENNFVDLREEHLMEFEVNFVEFLKLKIFFELILVLICPPVRVPVQASMRIYRIVNFCPIIMKISRNLATIVI